MEALSVEPSGRRRLKRQLHIVQCCVVSSFVSEDGLGATISLGSGASSGDIVGMRSKVGHPIITVYCGVSDRSVGKYVQIQNQTDNLSSMQRVSTFLFYHNIATPLTSP